MPETGTVVLYALAAVTLIVTPGPNAIYVAARSLSQGRTAGVVSALGIEAGTLVHIGAAVAGLSALIASSDLAFDAIRYLDVAYLVYLDGVIDQPTWTAEYAFLPEMEKAIGAVTDPTWRNSQVVGPYDADTIRRLKDEAGELYVSGSITLVRAMLADGLVDELHLLVYPLTRGSGPRLFTEDAAPRKLSLQASEAYEQGVVYLNYRTQA